MRNTATHLGANTVFGDGLINPTAAVLTARAYRATAHPSHAQITRQSNRFYFNQYMKALRN